MEEKVLEGFDEGKKEAIHKLLKEEEICHWHNGGNYHYCKNDGERRP